MRPKWRSSQRALRRNLNFSQFPVHWARRIGLKEEGLFSDRSAFEESFLLPAMVYLSWKDENKTAFIVSHLSTFAGLFEWVFAKSTFKYIMKIWTKKWKGRFKQNMKQYRTQLRCCEKRNSCLNSLPSLSCDQQRSAKRYQAPAHRWTLADSTQQVRWKVEFGSQTKRN